ncbi:MAG TPA: TonB-dependent receptor [Opitutaceae bacterium]|nr:TonB-dependent receptor [Opitutaceae bacterium]
MSTPIHHRSKSPASRHRLTWSRLAFVDSSPLAALAAGLILGLAPAASAQTTPAPAAAPEETVQLSPFEVRSTPVGPYQATAALAGGRIAEDIFESVSSVTIVTQDFINDTAPRDTFNATKYIAGISNNSSQVAGDRVSIRGFQVSSPDIDGFATVQSVVKNDPALYETIEFVRGPDSLLAPSGSPGGSLNLISKVARFGNFGSVTGQVGEYDTNSGNFDINQMVGSKAAYRLVASYINAPQGDNQGYHQSIGVEPSILLKLGPSSQLLLHATYFWGTAYNYLGFPIDPATRSIFSTIHFLPGLNKYQDSYADNSNDPSSANHSNRMIYRALFTTNLSDNLSMRLSARYLWEWETNNQWNLTGNAGGGYNPYTGVWVPGYVWSGSASTGFTASPAPATSSTYTLSQSPTNDLDHFIDVQNDWVYHLKSQYLDSQTILGFAGEVFHTVGKGYNATSPAINVYAIPSTATWTPATTPSSNLNATGNWEQVYLNEKLKFWDGRLIANASVVPTYFYESVANYISGLTPTSHPNPTFVNYGLTYVVRPWASLFYGHSEDAAQINPPPIASATSPNPPELQSGKQDQAGLRLKFLNGRATASATYFQLYQTNNQVVNPALFSVPPPTVFPPTLFSDRTARGWEFETNVNLTTGLSIIGNFTTLTNRSPYDVRFRADPENFGGLFLNYRFQEGSLKGLSVGAGYVFQGKAAGDSASGVTNASTTTQLIPNQPSFYIPAYGLLNLTASYKFGQHWIIRAYLDNALDKSYIAGSLNANAVMPGIPINPHAAITYSF